MALKQYILLFQKAATGSKVCDSLDDFKFALSEVNMPDEEVVELTTRKFAGVSGEDTYFPQTSALSAFDITYTLIYKGGLGTWRDAKNALRDYLRGATDAGTELKIYDTYNNVGYAGVWLKKISNIEPKQSNIDEALKLTLTFRVSDPSQEVKPAFKADGSVSNLSNA
jgi:hypothetical protein